ncbi:MAG: hypothetical protein WA840_17925 [Caulobacteraceae bacterium]
MKRENQENGGAYGEQHRRRLQSLPYEGDDRKTRIRGAIMASITPWYISGSNATECDKLGHINVSFLYNKAQVGLAEQSFDAITVEVGLSD